MTDEAMTLAEGPSQGSRRAALEAVLERWRRSAPDARAALREFPELAQDKSVVVELAYVAFQRRRKAGESLDFQQYCGQFPEIESTLLNILEIDQFLSSNSELLDDEVADWPVAPDRVGDFDILEELGRGAFSRVYLARERSLGHRLVALKASQFDVGEAATLGRLNHPHVMPVYSVGYQAELGLHFLRMPYYGRATLADVLQTVRRSPAVSGEVFRPSSNAGAPLLPAARLPGRWDGFADYESAVIQIGVAVAEGLAHAHRQGVYHLDLKPSNILVTPDGRPVLLDFNLAVDSRQLSRRLGGTLPYMAPEVLEAIASSGKTGGDIGASADVYGLGVLLFQLLTLELPYDMERRDRPFLELAEKQARRIAQVPLRWPTSAGGIDRRTRRTIERCLSYSPENRPRSAEELGRQLSRCLSLGARLERRVRRRPATSVAILAAGALLATAGIALASLQPPAFLRNYEAGVAASSVGRHEEAVERFNEALRDRPDHVESWVGRAFVLARDHNYAAALESARAGNVLSLTQRGSELECYLLCRLGRYSEAADVAERHLKSFEPSAKLLNNYGYALFRSKRTSDAKSVLERACQEETSPIAAFFNRALIDLQNSMTSGRRAPAQSLEDLRRVVATSPNNGEPYFSLAYLLAHDRTSHALQEIRGLLRRSIQYGASPKLIRTLRPLLPEITTEEFDDISSTPVASTTFQFDSLVPPQ